MSWTPPDRNEPGKRADRTERAQKSGEENGPVGVDPETVEQDMARYGALIANAKDVVDHNINAPVTVSRFGFVNALLRAFFRRSD